MRPEKETRAPEPRLTPFGTSPKRSTYTYLLADEASREAVILDPVLDQLDRDATLIEVLGLKLVAALDTHVHADHVTALGALKRRFVAQITANPAGSCPPADRTVQSCNLRRHDTRRIGPTTDRNVLLRSRRPCGTRHNHCRRSRRESRAASRRTRNLHHIRSRHRGARRSRGRRRGIRFPRCKFEGSDWPRSRKQTPPRSRSCRGNRRSAGVVGHSALPHRSCSPSRWRIHSIDPKRSAARLDILGARRTQSCCRLVPARQRRPLGHRHFLPCHRRQSCCRRKYRRRSCCSFPLGGRRPQCWLPPSVCRTRSDRCTLRRHRPGRAAQVTQRHRAPCREVVLSRLDRQLPHFVHREPARVALEVRGGFGASPRVMPSAQ